MRVSLCLLASMVCAAQLAGQTPDPDAAPAKPNATAIVDAVAALGAQDLRSIRYTGASSNHAGALDPRAPRHAVKVYDVAIDYPASAMQIELVRGISSVSPEEGVPASVEPRQVEAVNGRTAWDAVAPAAAVAPRKKREAKQVAQTADAAVPPPQANPDAAGERRQRIWITPHGFLKAALGNQPALRPAGNGTEVSFYLGTQRFIGFINSKNEVERVRTWVKRASGDLLIDTTYTEYRQFGSTLFPTRIVQRVTGEPVLDLSITAVQPNAPVRVVVPATLTASGR